MFHGLEGSARSHYANDMLATLSSQGWQCVLMHFRGCGLGLNRLARSYHSGDTEDAKLLLTHLAESFPSVPRVAIGFSLGANMLMKLLGEVPEHQWLDAAVAIAPPFRLRACADSVNSGFSRVYQHYLLTSMRNKSLQKLARGDFAAYPWLTKAHIENIRSFIEFDESITAPLHGYKNADEYYEKASASLYAKKILTPTLMIHSIDDPFMSEDVVPSSNELSTNVALELHNNGGHVGFLKGLPWRSNVWLHERVPEFINRFGVDII